jgi:hypothetical protein
MLTANIAAPSAVIAPAVLLLAKGAIAMSWMKVAALSGVLLIAGVGIGIGTAGPKQPPANLPLANKDPQPPANRDELEKQFVEEFSTLITRPDNPADSPLKKLMTERVNSAAREIQERMADYRVGRATLFVCLDAAKRGMTASLELAGKDQARRIAVCQGYVAISRRILDLNKARFEVGALKLQDMEQSRYQYLDAEIQLLREQGVKE